MRYNSYTPRIQTKSKSALITHHSKICNPQSEIRSPCSSKDRAVLSEGTDAGSIPAGDVLKIISKSIRKQII